MSLVPRIPQELVNKILEELDSLEAADRNTLRACCIVSSSFHDHAQERLYRSLSMTLSSSPALKATADALINVLTSSHRLRSFVESLAIRFQGGQSSYPYFDITLKLPRLSHLTLSNEKESRDRVSWLVLRAGLRSSLSELLRSSSLRVLSISHICFIPALLISSCAHLRELHLWDIIFLKSDQDGNAPWNTPCTPSISPTQTYLESLSLRITARPRLLCDTLTHPASSLSITRLRRLTIEIWDNEDFTGCQELLELTGPSLEAFTLKFIQQFLGDLILPTLPKLQHLTIINPNHRTIQRLPSLLDSTHVKDVSLTIDDYLCRWDHHFRFVAGYWQRIDEAMCTTHPSANLRITVEHTSRASADPGGDARNYFTSNMPRLFAAGRLCVELGWRDFQTHLEMVIPLNPALIHRPQE
ncbi:hypothetical protein FPV67DRAFT_1779368 [Lyophyllum atratum]|nr:hypothetical protein FPV67DRAFT_1779368 [Lyophyllum atratum]